MKLNNKDLVCDKCVYETMPSGVSFLVYGCKKHRSLFFKEMSNVISRVQEDILISQPIPKELKIN